MRFFFSVTVLPLIFEIHLSCQLSAGIHFIAVGSGLFFTAASGKKPCLAHCRSFRRSLPKRKIFAVWTDLETWPWLSRCASLAMPATNDKNDSFLQAWLESHHDSHFSSLFEVSGILVSDTYARQGSRSSHFTMPGTY